jgi:hypothetical protein
MIKLLVGMIASGKSTYAKEKAAEGWLTINDDAIVNLVHGNNYLLYDKKLKLLYKSIEHNTTNLILCSGRDLIVDNGRANLTVEGRQRWIAMCRSFDIGIQAVIFPKEDYIVHADRRFNSDPRGESLENWIKIAKTHEEIYQAPALNEGFSEISYV